MKVCIFCSPTRVHVYCSLRAGPFHVYLYLIYSYPCTVDWYQMRSTQSLCTFLWCNKYQFTFSSDPMPWHMTTFNLINHVDQADTPNEMSCPFLVVHCSWQKLAVIQNWFRFCLPLCLAVPDPYQTGVAVSSTLIPMLSGVIIGGRDIPWSWSCVLRWGALQSMWSGW